MLMPPTSNAFGPRILACQDQQRDLSQGLRELLDDIFCGKKRHKTISKDVYSHAEP
jgi:hypothetical protein